MIKKTSNQVGEFTHPLAPSQIVGEKSGMIGDN
jgi:hypothetical protein